MRSLSLTLLAAGAVLMCAAPHAHAQYFNITTQFQSAAGVAVTGAPSTDGLSLLGVNGSMLTGVNATPAAVTTPLYTFATNSNANTPGNNAGSFNYAYRISVIIVPSTSTGTPLAGYNAITQYVTGTITGNLTVQTNSLVNTYDNLVTTPSGQAEVLNYVFTAAGMPSVSFQLRALEATTTTFLGPGFDNGGSPVAKAGSATAAIAGTPEPGTLALFLGMSMSGAMVARRRMRRK